MRVLFFSVRVRIGFFLALLFLINPALVDAQSRMATLELPQETPPVVVPASATRPSTVSQPLAADSSNFGRSNEPPTHAFCPDCCCPPRFWVSTEFLLWWIRSGPIHSPVVTTGPGSDDPPGAVGQPGTQILFGDKPMDYGTFSGMRLGAGLPVNSWLSLEGSYFFLERRSVQFGATSDASGSPFILRPILDNQDGREEVYGVSVPAPNLGPWAGGIFAASHTSLQGWQVNLSSLLWSRERLRFEAIAGFRALDLNEDLDILENMTPLAPGVLVLASLPADPPSTLTVFDGIHTSNHFYGGQLGGRMTWQRGSLSMSLAGTAALGCTQQVATINGISTLNTPGVPAVTVPGGVLATSSNIGRYYRSTFGVVPEGSLTVGCQFTSRVKATMGYSFLYWSQVARPGNQFEHINNPALVPTSGLFGNGLGANQPAFSFHESDFWAQGIRFGLEFTF